MARADGRPDLYVVARFLDALAEPEARRSRNQLQMAVRLNYDIYRRYLALLLERGLIASVPDGGREVIVLTAEGRKLRSDMEGWLRNLLGH